MDELFLQEVEDLLKIEQKESQKRWKESMEKYIKNEMMVYSRLFFLRLEKHLGFGKRLYINGLLDYKAGEVEKCSKEEKKWLIEQIINKIKNEKSQTVFYSQIAHRKVRDISDRLRITVKGEIAKEIVFISEEEKEEIFHHVIELLQLHLEKEIGINHPKAPQKFAEHAIFLYESPYVKDFRFLEWLQEKNIDVFFEQEQIEEMKIYLKKWYQTKKEKPDLVGNKSDVKELKEYRYLMNNRDKEGIVQQVEENLKKELEVLKREKQFRPSLLKEHELKEIKEKLIALQTF